MTIKSLLLVGTALVGALLASPAGAATGTATAATGFQAGDILLRARALAVLPQTSTDFISTLGGHAEASNSVVPEIDATYFFTPNIAAELIAATTPHHVTAHGTSVGNLDLGHVWLLPPTLTVQYHFMPDHVVSPYVGAGVNYTYFYDHDLPGGTVNSIRYENGWGGAFQAGADFHVAGNWYANVDVKYVLIDTSVKLNGGTYHADVNLDPVLVGIGLGYKF